MHYIIKGGGKKHNQENKKRESCRSQTEQTIEKGDKDAERKKVVLPKKLRRGKK